MLCSVVSAQSADRPKIYIYQVRVTTSGSASERDRAEIPSFREILKRFNYETNECEAQRTTLDELLRERASPQKPGSYPAIGKRRELLETTICRVPSDDTVIYNIELNLSVDSRLKNRRATVIAIPIGGGEQLSGGYAHKPGEVVGWYDVMSRAVERSFGGFNDSTAISGEFPTEAQVGDTVTLDARDSWDPDGDAFELRWRITTRACVGPKGMLPADGRACDPGTKRSEVKVPDQAGKYEHTRTFRVPMVGEYNVYLHAKIGSREEPEQLVTKIRAEPRRGRTIFSRVGVIALPMDYLRSINKQELGVLISAGWMKRLTHRIGFAALHEEILLGFSLSSLRPAKPFSVQPPGGTFLGLEVVARTLDRTGRFGLSMPLSLSGGYAISKRLDYDEIEVIWLADLLVGGYLTMGENYREVSVAFCGKFCPSFTVGPTLSLIGNPTRSQIAAVTGAELIMGVEY